MELWTEYEGRTIDGAYPLTKLLQPEGRSAFFATSNGSGEQTVIRLIESHFDDEEILGRWRGIRALDHPNLVRLKQFGSVVLDETSLVYAVIEPVDANLAEIVNQRPLSVEETRQLATSMVAALDALHTSGFVHEHVAAHTVLAVGEMIKLRSDCIREAPEGEEGRWLKEKDVRDLALVLLEALTQRKNLEEVDYALPVPFDQIVRKGLSGEWGLAESSHALDHTERTATPLEQGNHAAAAGVEGRNGVSALPVESKIIEMPTRVERIGTPITKGNSRVRVTAGAWVVLGLILALFLGLGWHFVHGRPTSESQAATSSVAAVPLERSEAATRTAPATQEAGTAITPNSTIATKAKNAVTGGRQKWRVVAFTYNYEGQAQQKVNAVEQRHPGLHPEVFSPNGRAPYLVTIGGSMSRDDAFALAKRARREGVARDVYAQNYSGRG